MIDALLVGPGDPFAPIRARFPKEPVLVEPELLPDGDLPEGNVVRLGAREILKGRAEALFRHDAQVRLDSAFHDD